LTSKGQYLFLRRIPADLRSDKHWIKPLIAMMMLFYWMVTALPSPLFNTTYSTVLVDSKGELLSGRVAADEQWRFPVADTLPARYVICLLMSEDRHFFRHQGVHTLSLAKALVENLRAGRIRRGGSTITMQVIRLSRGNPPRTLMQKGVEILLAYRLEMSYSKEEILRLYAAHAPFGSNVVGLEAASWRFYGKSSGMLTWAESATLAVLPNSPGQIYPGRNAPKLLGKRNRLLKTLCDSGIITEETYDLSISEPLPGAPGILPDEAPHLLDRMLRAGRKGMVSQTTIDAGLQEQVNDIVARHHEQLAGTNIHNMAVLVLETRTGAVRAYIGNVRGAGEQNGEAVDIIPARRSSGSILKPFLYAMMMDDGQILPGMLVRDVPVQIGNFRPVNYSRQYSGAVPARKALARSLNIPAVLMLKDYGTARFCDRMRTMGMSTLERQASHYGLSVILGGAETRLWELCGFYASMGRTLQRFSETDGRYLHGDFHPPLVLVEEYLAEKGRSGKLKKSPEMFHASSIWLTFSAMIEVARPDEEANWSWFASMPAVAWKTGTSFGNRDAWAIGVSPGYVVGVWVGNASGEGRPSLTGTAVAAPVMFDVFSRLRKGSWFDTPWDDLAPVVVCRHSGHPASSCCGETDTVFSADVNLKVPVCPYHQMVHLDPTGRYQVNSHCEEPSAMIHQCWFILPPAVEYYFKPLNPFYRSLPPYRDDCIRDIRGRDVMEVIYPVDLGEIFIPVDISGQLGKVIFEVAHQQRHSRIFWYLDDQFLGTTTGIHKMSLQPGPGWHILTLTDDQGYRTSRRFRVADKKK
jgi:penicillin-binding protein 1C